MYELEVLDRLSFSSGAGARILSDEIKVSRREGAGQVRVRGS